MARRRRKRKAGKWLGRLIIAVFAVPALYLAAALVGSLAAVNNGWAEPSAGITIYIADNGIHADIIMPVKADGLDWAPLIPTSDFASPPPNPALDRVRLGRGARLSRHAELVGHYPAYDLVRAKWWPAGDACRICSEPLLRGAPDPLAARGVSPTCGLRFARISRSTRRGMHNGSTILAMDPPTPSTGRLARPTRCAHATPPRRTGFGLPG